MCETGNEIDKSGLWKIIEESVKLKLMSLTVKRSVNVMKIAQRWNVKMNYVKNNAKVNVRVP